MPDLRRTRIKFCGLTRAEDLAEACALGVDAIGFVFAEQSKRRVSPQAAAALRHALQPFVDTVALFMDNDTDTVRDSIATVRPTWLQFHGGEDDGFCAGFGLPYLKAIAMGGDADIDAPHCCATTKPAAAATRSTGRASLRIARDRICSPAD
jgi:phosphoribosylanthranilate isomerase